MATVIIMAVLCWVFYCLGLLTMAIFVVARKEPRFPTIKDGHKMRRNWSVQKSLTYPVERSVPRHVVAKSK